MKLRKINEANEVKTDVRQVEKDVKDAAALNWDQAEAIVDYDKKKKEVKKELTPVIDNAEDIVKQTAPQEKAPENIVNEAVIKEEPELDPRFDSAKSFYGKARYEDEPDGSVTLYSYDTPVAKITSDHNVQLLPDWDYSQTTLRHVKDFLKQHGFFAGSKKQMQHDYIDVPSTGMLGEEVIKEEDGAPAVDDVKRGLSAVLNDLIIDEWEAVDGYNSAIGTVEYEGKYPELLEILRDIVTEEMIHIGQLQKAMTLVDEAAKAIKDGEAEAEEEQHMEEDPADVIGDLKLELEEPDIEEK